MIVLLKFFICFLVYRICFKLYQHNFVFLHDIGSLPQINNNDLENYDYEHKIVRTKTCSIHSYIFYTNSDRTLFYCHGNKGNIKVNLNKIKNLYHTLNMNIIIGDYCNFGNSKDVSCTNFNKNGMRRDVILMYEACVLNNQRLPNKNVYVYGISLGGIPAMSLGCYLSGKCNGIIIENTMFDLRTMISRSVFSLYSDMFSISKFSNQQALYHMNRNIPLLFLISKNDPVIHYSNSIDLYRYALKLGFKNIRKVIFHKAKHVDIWRTEKSLYNDILSAFIFCNKNKK